MHKGDKFPRTGTPLIAPTVPNPITNTELNAIADALVPDPLDDAGLEAFRQQLDREKAHLPDPYVDDPESLFKWKADSVLREVEIWPRSRRVAARRAHSAAVESLGLNRHELKLRRFHTYETAQVFAAIIMTDGVPVDARQVATNQLARMMRPEAEYAGMVRYFVNDVWQLSVAG